MDRRSGRVATSAMVVGWRGLWRVELAALAALGVTLCSCSTGVAGPRCRNDAECEEPAVCRFNAGEFGSRCATGCETDDDCPLDGEVCHLDFGAACLPPCTRSDTRDRSAYCNEASQRFQSCERAAGLGCLSARCGCGENERCDEQNDRCISIIPLGEPCERDVECETGICGIATDTCIPRGGLGAVCATHNECNSDNCTALWRRGRDDIEPGVCGVEQFETCDPNNVDECRVCERLASGSGAEVLSCARLCAENGAPVDCRGGEYCLPTFGDVWVCRTWCGQRITTDRDDPINGREVVRDANRCRPGFSCEENDDFPVDDERHWVCLPRFF